MPTAINYIATAMLFISVAPLPYGYYILLRLVVRGTFGYAAYIAYTKNNQSLPWVYGVMAVLFNPIIKIHFKGILGCYRCSGRYSFAGNQR
jgi:hypothetical protein